MLPAATLPPYLQPHLPAHPAPASEPPSAPQPVFEKRPEMLPVFGMMCEPERAIVFRVPWCEPMCHCACACCLCSVCKKDQCAIAFRVPWWVVSNTLRLLFSTVISTAGPFLACCGVCRGSLAKAPVLTRASAASGPQLLLSLLTLLQAGRCWQPAGTCRQRSMVVQTAVSSRAGGQSAHACPAMHTCGLQVHA